jgi:glycosyltransferase involved in cell wall biosynthesis
MRIAIDVTSLLDQYSNRGIGNYTKNLVKRLILNTEHEWHLIGFLTKKENESALNQKLKNVYFHSIGPVQFSSIISNKKVDFKIQQSLELISPDIFFVANFEHRSWSGTWKTIVMIHDLIPLTFKSYSTKGFFANLLKGMFYKSRLKYVKQANHIITNSNYSESEIVRLLDIPTNKITPIPLGVEKIIPNETNKSTLMQSLGIMGDYLLYYGGIEPNKNIEYLIEIFQKIAKKKEDIQLVIVSKDLKKNSSTKEIVANSKQANLLKEKIQKILQTNKQSQLLNRIVLPGEMKDELKTLLSNATAFVHLSKSEGFGLSVAEALSLGKPTFVSNIPVYKELYEGAVSFLPLNKAMEAAKIILNTLEDKMTMKTLSALAIKKAESYSWDNTANQTLELFNSVRYQTDMFAKTKPHKVAFVAPYFFPYKGGAETYSFSIARRLVESGFLVDAYTSRYEKRQPRFEHKFGINIRRSYAIIKGYYSRFYPTLLFSILFSNANIFHVQGFGFIWQDFLLIIKKFFSTKRHKFINTPHGPFMARKEYSGIELRIKKLFTKIQRFYLNWLYDVVIAVNPLQVEWIHSEYKIDISKIKCLPIGISEEHFDRIDQIEVENNFNPKHKIIGTFLGRFHRYKGVIKLVRAIASQPREMRSKLLFIFMGKDVDALEEMQRLIKENKLEDTIKIIVGPTDQRRNEILEISDFFVFPSEWEAYGIAMLEAMAHKNAIISTRTEGGQYLVNSKNGILYDIEEEAKLSEAIESLVLNDEMRETMKVESFKRAQNLIWNRVWGEYLELYKSISL